jgi:hypothetical protein
MKKYLILAATCCLLSGSCSKDEIPIDKDNLLLGVWNYTRADNEVFIYSRAQSFSQCLGYTFREDGSLVERGLAGFCATPPVSYSDYQGTWTILSRNMVKVDVSNYDGPKSYRMEIRSVDNDSLKVVRIY